MDVRWSPAPAVGSDNTHLRLYSVLRRGKTRPAREKAHQGWLQRLVWPYRVSACIQSVPRVYLRRGIVGLQTRAPQWISVQHQRRITEALAEHKLARTLSKPWVITRLGRREPRTSTRYDVGPNAPLHRSRRPAGRTRARHPRLVRRGVARDEKQQ